MTRGKQMIQRDKNRDDRKRYCIMKYIYSICSTTKLSVRCFEWRISRLTIIWSRRLKRTNSISIIDSYEFFLPFRGTILERRFRLTHGRYRFRFKSRRNIKQTVLMCSTGCLTDSLVCQRVACPPPSPDSCSHDWENAKEQQTTFCPIFCSRIATLDFPRINLSHLMRIGATGE